MAWLEQNFRMVVKVIDNGLNESTITYEMTAGDHATALTDALLIIGILEEVCAAATVSYSINQQFVNDSLVVPASAAVQVEAKALLIMRDGTNPVKKHLARIPAPETDVFLSTEGDGANIVDVTHQHVIDYNDMFDSSGECYISDGESTETGGPIKGRRVSHRSRRG